MATISPPYKPPEQVAPGIFMVPIPIPIPLRYTNCFLFEGPSGWTLVDAGFHDALAEDAWPRAFADMAIRPQDVKQILVTHYHPDHLGGAGWLQQLTGAPAYMHDRELRQVELFWGQSMAEQAAALRDFFAVEGMPRETAEAIAQHHHHQWGIVQPLAELKPLKAGTMFPMGRSAYEVMWVPGHSDGMAVFWDAQTGVLVANDMILDKITPNVSLWPDCRPNPLEDYLASLVTVEGLGATLALTGHRNLITNVTGRAQEIRDHHFHRLGVMEAVCGKAGGATAWEVCEQVFTPGTLTIHQVRFAMSETLAHLVYLEKLGRLVRQGDRFVRV